ncbi:hypothetical protein ACFL54_05825 [Planctomycetota bacterium]
MCNTSALARNWRPFILSLVFPGLGQVFAGWRVLGVLIMLVFSFFLTFDIYYLLHVDWDSRWLTHEDNFEKAVVITTFEAFVYAFSAIHAFIFVKVKDKTLPKMNIMNHFRNFRTAWPDISLGIVFFTTVICYYQKVPNAKEVAKYIARWGSAELIYILPVFALFMIYRDNKLTLKEICCWLIPMTLIAFILGNIFFMTGWEKFFINFFLILTPRFTGIFFFTVNVRKNYSYRLRCAKCFTALLASFLLLFSICILFQNDRLASLKRAFASYEFLCLWGMFYYPILATLEMLYGPIVNPDGIEKITKDL